jgi:hypothetical protein
VKEKMPKKVNPEVWLELFGGGMVTDSKGKQHDGDQIIDQVLASFAAQGGKIDAPLVIGHPDDEAPSYGKIVAVKETVRDGRRWLLGKPADVLASFARQVNSGWFPGRSISVDETGKMLHVGFLPPGVNPAVKGMLPAQFADGGTVFFSEFMGADRFFLRRLRDWIISRFGIDEADGVIGQHELDAMLESELAEAKGEAGEEDVSISGFKEKHKENDDMAGEKQFSAADIEAAKKEAAAAAETKIKAEFAAAQAEEAKQRAGVDFAAVTSQRIKDGKWAPAIKDAGLLKLAEGFGSDKIEFSQADGSTIKKSQHELLISIIDAAVKGGQMHKTEFALEEDEDKPVDTKDAKKGKEVHDKAKAYQFQQKQAGVDIEFRDAVRHVTGGK